jgi:hypothetical protein
VLPGSGVYSLRCSSRGKASMHRERESSPLVHLAGFGQSEAFTVPLALLLVLCPVLPPSCVTVPVLLVHPCLTTLCGV